MSRCQLKLKKHGHKHGGMAAKHHKVSLFAFQLLSVQSDTAEAYGLHTMAILLLGVEVTAITIQTQWPIEKNMSVQTTCWFGNWKTSGL